MTALHKFVLSHTLFLCTLSFGKWGDLVAGGNACNRKNVTRIEDGENLSLIFNALTIDMPEGSRGDGTHVNRTCHLRINIQHPEGQRLASFKQVYSGGIIKSANSASQLEIRYSIDAMNRSFRQFS